MYIVHFGGLLMNEALGRLHLISDERWDRSNCKHFMAMKFWFENATGKDFIEQIKKDEHS
jgi:hypothetical protein